MSPDPSAGLSREELAAALRAVGIEVRAGTYLTGSQRKLTEYWVTGPGRAKIAWNTPGDFKRCVAELGKYVRDPEGLCNRYHTLATGGPPGHGSAE